MGHDPITEGDFVYVDPNAPLPDLSSTRPSSAARGAVGSALEDIVAAAEAGSLRVDPVTGQATIQALTRVRDEVDSYRRLLAEGTRLGGGYAARIDRFVTEWTVSGSGSATEVMAEFSRQLGRLSDAVRTSMTTYQATDDGAVRHLDQAEVAR